MIPVLYPPNATDFSTFGRGVLTDTVSCEVTEERNGVFECLLKYPVSGQHYGLITKECIVKAKPNDTAADQAFRIYRITKPLNGIVAIYGQHISYDLANVPCFRFRRRIAHRSASSRSFCREIHASRVGRTIRMQRHSRSPSRKVFEPVWAARKAPCFLSGTANLSGTTLR